MAERRRVNSLNYGDLLNLTARVLRENEAVRRALQHKFRHLLVDEFQDTDPVQAEIVFWLAEDGAAPSAAKPKASADWRNVPLRPGALFVVGDPKQSIYRFRRADIDIYNIVRQRFSDPAVGCVVPLTLNFRSVPQLCEWANQVFQTRFPARTDRARASLRGARSERSSRRSRWRVHADAPLRSATAPGAGRREDRDLHSIGSRCRTAPVQRLPDSDQEEAQPPRALCPCPGVAQHSDRGERRRRLRRVAGGRGVDDAAARARRSSGCAAADRCAARPAVRRQRSGALCLQAGRRLVQHLPAR